MKLKDKVMWILDDVLDVWKILLGFLAVGTVFVLMSTGVKYVLTEMGLQLEEESMCNLSMIITALLILSVFIAIASEKGQKLKSVLLIVGGLIGIFLYMAFVVFTWCEVVMLADQTGLGTWFNCVVAIGMLFLHVGLLPVILYLI